MSANCNTTNTKGFTIGQIIREFGQQFMEQYKPGYRTMKVLHNIANCRTSALGGHWVKCSNCNYENKVYNSCGRLKLPSMSEP